MPLGDQQLHYSQNLEIEQEVLSTLHLLNIYISSEFNDGDVPPGLSANFIVVGPIAGKGA